MVGDDADRKAAETREPDDDVRRVMLLNFKKIILVGNRVYNFADVVRLSRNFGSRRVPD